MNTTDIILTIIIAAAAIRAVISCVKRSRSKDCGCGCGCEGCTKGCKRK